MATAAATVKISAAVEEESEPDLFGDPVAAARAAGLRYVNDKRPGITRRKVGKHFSYRAADGTVIRDSDVLQRIRSLAIPPAWTDVWICPRPNGHIQATGRDARGRKQYRYHAKWREARDEAKFAHTIAFAQALPKIRARVQEDLQRSGLPREKVLATVVDLLERTLIRVGNDEYARDNDSYGLTTMRDEHVEVGSKKVAFRFRGKSGQEHEIGISDRRVANVVRKCQDLPGQELFQYLDENGDVRDIDSADVNEYLRETTGEDYTAKDFRTWAATVLTAKALQAFETFESPTAAKKNVVRAIEDVARELGNTPSVCRKCYVHPAIIDAYLDGSTLDVLTQQAEEELVENMHALRPEEDAVLGLLEKQLAASVETAAPSRTAA